MSASSPHDEFVVNASACFQPISRNFSINVDFIIWRKELSILNISPSVVLTEDELRNKARKEAVLIQQYLAVNPHSWQEHCQDAIQRLQFRCLAAGFAGPKCLIRWIWATEEMKGCRRMLSGNCTHREGQKWMLTISYTAFRVCQCWHKCPRQKSTVHSINWQLMPMKWQLLMLLRSWWSVNVVTSCHITPTIYAIV